VAETRAAEASGLADALRTELAEANEALEAQAYIYIYREREREIDIDIDRDR